MKALLYKELKLAMHPICYVFIFVFPFMILIPNYPIAISFIYVLTCYPILFLGANKGQQSNDLLYSVLLPIRKKDIVLARILMVCIMQFVSAAVSSLLYPLSLLVRQSMLSGGATPSASGIGLDGYLSLLGIVFIGYAISDLIFFPIYYKKGKSIVMSTLLTIFGFIVYIAIFTIALVYIPGMEWYTNLVTGEMWIQSIIFAASLLVYVLLHFLVYRISSKRLDLVDF